MKYYLAYFTQNDGEHEHIDRITVKATSETKANKLCMSELYEYGNSKTSSIFSYGDGETAIKKYWLSEIPYKDYKVLAKYLGGLK